MNWSIRYAGEELSQPSQTENIFPIQSININTSDFAKGFLGQGGSIYSRLNDGTGRWHRRINKKAFEDDTRSYKSRGVTNQYTVFVHPKVSFGITSQSVFGDQPPVKIHKKDGKDIAFSLGYDSKDNWVYLNKDHISIEPKVGWVPVQFGTAHWSNDEIDEDHSHVGSPVKEII